jgi:hypothetical protein
MIGLAGRPSLRGPWLVYEEFYDPNVRDWAWARSWGAEVAIDSPASPRSGPNPSCLVPPRASCTYARKLERLDGFGVSRLHGLAFEPGRENLDLLRPHSDPWNSEVKSSLGSPTLCAHITSFQSLYDT